MTNAVTYRAARWLAVVAVLMMGVGLAARAEAQSPRDRARKAFADGKLLYEQQRYAEAVAKFELADQLAPAPLLSFNIGLAYDAMGNADQALLHYRRYLQRAPNAANRSVVEGKINRLEGQLRAKAAEEAAARKAAEEAAARKAAEEAAARKAAEEAAAAESAGQPEPPPADSGPADPGAGAVAPPPADQPPPPPAAKPDPFESTGDPELDSVARIDVTGLREQRGLAGYSGNPAGPGPGPATGPAGTADAPPPPGPRPMDGGKKKSKPVYKQWWFWVIVGVSAIILIDIATTDNSSNNATRLVVPVGSPSTATAPGGLSWRF